LSIYIGIDPGKTGAIAFCVHGSYEVLDWDDGNALELLQYLGRRCEGIGIHAVVEKQQAFPQQGVSSTFKIAHNYGLWCGRLEALEIPYDIVTPLKWKKEIFDSMPKSADQKEMARDRARRLFPQLSDHLKRKKDHGRAEALLICEFCKRKYSSPKL